MIEKVAVVRAEEGLHARPATQFAEVASGLPVAVRIRTATSEPQAADSMLGLMLLGARSGDEVTLSADGDGAEEALATLVDLLENPH